MISLKASIRVSDNFSETKLTIDFRIDISVVFDILSPNVTVMDRGGEMFSLFKTMRREETSFSNLCRNESMLSDITAFEVNSEEKMNKPGRL